MKKALALGSVVAALMCTFALEGDAQACGGCFPPQETPSIVTDHRMIFTIARDQSTLYDQIRYSGSPKSFAWVLPIVGEVKVGLSSDSVFQALDAMTQTTVIAPPRNCPPPPDCPNDSRNSASAGSSSSSGGSGGVEVTKRETVGPYDTVQLKATDPAALQNWLQQNGFQIPPDVKPVVDQYVTEKFDFLALKLLPGKDVTDMRPVRITTPGANNILPLRMVAAGTGATVGISLWMIGEGRYEPQNFPTFSITTDELLWDWNTNSSNYKDLRAQKTIAGGGKAWEIESSMLIQPQDVITAVKNGYFGNSRGGNGPYVPGDPNADGYLPVKDQQGVVTKTQQQVREEDFEALFHGIPASTSRITRLRADLSKSALATDLSMAAAGNQDQLAAQRQVTKEANQPQCPVYNGCEQVGTAPRDQAAGQTTNGGDGTFSCATVAKNAMHDASPTGLAVGGGFLALVLAKASRRRSRN